MATATGAEGSAEGPDPERCDSAGEYAAQALKQADETVRPADIASEYGCSNGHMRNTLRRMMRNGRAERIDHGEYVLPGEGDADGWGDGAGEATAPPSESGAETPQGEAVAEGPPDGSADQAEMLERQRKTAGDDDQEDVGDGDDLEDGKRADRPELEDDETADFSPVEHDGPVPTHHGHSDEGPAKPDPDEVDVDELAPETDDPAGVEEAGDVDEGDGADEADREVREATEETSAGIPIPVSTTTLFIGVVILLVFLLYMQSDAGGDVDEGDGADEATGAIRGLVDEI